MTIGLAELPNLPRWHSKEGRVILIDFGHAGYLGDQIPPQKRAPFVKSDTYSVEHDVNGLKRLLGMSTY